MGTVAFLVSQYTGVPYIQIALHALIPACLYFTGIFLAVHWSALRLGLRGIPPEQLPPWQGTLKERGHLMVPVAVLLVLLARGYTPQFAVAHSILSVVVVANLRRQTRMGPRDILAALEKGAQGALIVAIATATAGIVVGVFDLTGAGLQLAQAATRGISWLLPGLVVTMVVSLLLGMGLPPSASYILQVPITIPMLMGFLRSQGVEPATAVLVSHFFVMYFAALAVLTPPDALASVAAAGISGSDFMATAFLATRVAFAAFVVPFIFAYRPGLLLLGSPGEVATSVLFALAGIFAVSLAFEGYALRPMTPPERLAMLLSGAALIVPARSTDLPGLAGLVAVLVWHWASGRRGTPEAAMAGAVRAARPDRR